MINLCKGSEHRQYAMDYRYTSTAPPMHVTTAQPQRMGPTSCRVTCPSCQATVSTRVDKTATSKTHLFALLCCFFGCCCIPYCMDSCKATTHNCPVCNAYLGTYEN